MRAGHTSLTLAEMRGIARRRGGMCLSKTFVNCQTKLWWRCSEGHEWDAVPNIIKHQGTRCPCCGGRRVDIAEMRAPARAARIRVAAAAWAPTADDAMLRATSPDFLFSTVQQMADVLARGAA